MEHPIHRRRAGRHSALTSAPGCGESHRIRPAAFETGAMTGGEGRDLVHEEQLSVAP
jgi:hypothetical protein